MSSQARPWSKQLPSGFAAPAVWDAVVVGSGMGGMTCAAMLAALGQRVLVLEQHYVPGGFTHEFRRGKYHWDVGVHAVGEVTTRSMPGRLLAALTGERLQWASLGPVYDAFEFPDGLRLGFPDNPRAFRELLVSHFPGEAAAIDGYFARTREVAAAMRGYYLARLAPAGAHVLTDMLTRPARRAFGETAADVLDRLTGDARLKTVLAAQWAYHGATPRKASFAIQALVTKHFLWGGYYPVGGSLAIARHLLQTVADAGGWTRISTDVAEVVLERGAAVGVRLKDGEELRARRVISAAGVLSTVQRLLPRAASESSWAASIRALPPAPAHVCLYLGFKGDIRAAGAGASNQWYYDTWDTEQDAWDVRDPEHLPDCPVLYCSYPSLKDPEHDPGPEQRHTGEVVTFVPWDRFTGWLGSRWRRRGGDYEQLKQALQSKLLAQYLKKMPALRPLVDHVELSTPLSTDTFVRPVQGSIYGLLPTPARFENPYLRPKSPIPGLYFAGSEVATVGVIGAMMGGALAAAAVDPIGAARLLRRL